MTSRYLAARLAQISRAIERGVPSSALADDAVLAVLPGFATAIAPRPR